MSEVSSQLPVSVNFSMWKGDTFKKTLTFTDATGNALDLSTAAIKMQIRKKAGEPVLMSLSINDGIVVSGQNNVVFNKKIDIEGGTYRYDIEVTYASGVVRTYVSGQFKVLDDITRTT